MFQQVDYGFLPPPDPGPWEAFKANLVNPTDQQALCRARRTWEDLKEVNHLPFTRMPELTGLCGGTVKGTTTRVSSMRFSSTPAPSTVTGQTKDPALLERSALPLTEWPSTTRKLTPTAPAPSTVSPTPSPGGGPTPGMVAAQPSTPAKGSTMDYGLLATGIGTAIGGPIGGVIGGATSLLGGGGSKCPGPYNYDSATGRCVPKPDYWARVGGGGETTTSPGVKPTGYVGGSGPCPVGYQWDGQRCIESGFGGSVARILPGGDTGTGMDVYGQAVVGAWGKPALVPYTGSVPTRRCPPGAVLGKDNLCYARGSIPNSARKWPKPPRPLLTAQEMKTLRKIKSLEKKVKRAWQAAGSPGKPRPQRKTTRRR